MKITDTEKKLVIIFAMIGCLSGVYLAIRLVVIMHETDRIHLIYGGDYFFLFDKYHNY